MKSQTLLLSSLLIALGLNLTACTKKEAAEGHKTEEIAAQQSEIAHKATPAPVASEPASPMPASNTATATASATVASTTTTTTTTTTDVVPVTVVAGSDAGEKLYNTTCKTCHEAGVAGAPKMGDAAAWKDRIAQGKDTLYKHSIEGFQGKAGVMPPKGGSTASDDEMKAAVDYMVSKSS